jgi:hypothetical protein
MYRVAVILNESETERYGWANVLPVLRKSVDHNEYDFDPYTAANIADFFRQISSYDSIFISYNACNDELLYEKLVANRSTIANFLDSGKGLFISFQKRVTDNKSLSGFLPEEYEYQIQGRKEASSEGRIEVPSGSEGSILLRFPRRVSTTEVLHRCRINEFKAHLYRGFIIPKNTYNFTPVFVDTSYGDQRKILVSTRYDFHARIVISTMPLDWEGHLNLLGNIITFISEGFPLVALVAKRGSETLDYDYLVSSLKFHKIPGKLYKVDNLDAQAIRTDVHKFYVFGPGWSEKQCADYWGRVHTKDQDCRAYFFRETSGIPSLVEYSKYSFSDSIILESLAWINSKFKDGAFQSSFWITYDVVDMLTSMSVSLDYVQDDILRRIREHDADGSYDALMGATCALVEMYSWLLGKDSSEYRRSLAWIGDNVHLASYYDQQTVILTLAKLGEPYNPETYRDIYNSLSDIPHTARLELSELELCRNAQFCLIEESDSALGWIDVLVRSQGVEGKWTNGARTATTVTFLTRHREMLSGALREVDEMISKGISYLSSEFNRSGVCWNSDVLTTAKATLALKLFQRLLEYPVEEAFLSIQRQHRTISNTQSSLYANLAIEGVRKELAEVKKDLDRHKGAVEYYKKTKTRFDIAKSIGVIVFVAVGALIIYMFHKERGHDFIKFIKDFIGDLQFIIPTVIAFLIGTWLHVKFIKWEERRGMNTERTVDDL